MTILAEDMTMITTTMTIITNDITTSAIRMAATSVITNSSNIPRKALISLAKTAIPFDDFELELPLSHN